MYSNQAVKGNAADPKLQPVFPTEGMPIFIDSWVMSKEAPNKDGAYQFLDFIMRPETAARIADLTKFTTPNKGAEPLLPDYYRDNPMLNLADEVVENTSFYIGVERVLEEYEHIYVEFKLRGNQSSGVSPALWKSSPLGCSLPLCFHGKADSL